MTGSPPSVQLDRDATWLVQALDPNSGLVRLVRMSSESYRAASFLDDRILAEQHEATILPWAEVAAAVTVQACKDARWIFHIGHVGSTLLARLLGELPDVLSVREPRILRDVAMVPPNQRAAFVGPLQSLLSRTFTPGQKALVKATSFVSEIAPELVPPRERALFLYAKPRAYIASILAGENSVKDIAALASSRSQRAAGRVTLPQPCNAAEAAAAAWACEMTSLESAAAAMADRRVEWADFDVFLNEVPRRLGELAEFFGFGAPPGSVEAIARGPLMRRYSKALQYEYSPSLRRELIAEADCANRAEIDRAVAMLESAAQASPLLARALNRAKDP